MSQANATFEQKSPKKRRYFWGMAAFLAWIVVLNAGITQWAAARLQYHPALTDQLSYHIYAPWAWLKWQFLFANSARMTWAMSNGILLVCFLGGCILVVSLRGSRRAPKAQEGIHGTAHWATEADIRAAGLLPDTDKPGQGVYVGGWTDPDGILRYLRHNGPEHIAGIAPTRSGKGVGLVVPTLLSWPHSCVVNDQKLELWQMTAGWRAKHANNRCLLFTPGNEEGGVSYNPVQEIRCGTPKEVADAQNLAMMLVDTKGEGLESHWDKTSHAFLTAVLLHLMHRARLKVATFLIAAISRRVALQLTDLQTKYEEADQEAGTAIDDAEVAARGREILERIGAVLQAVRSVPVWDALNVAESAAVVLFLNQPESAWTNEFMQWTNDGARWRQQRSVDITAINAFLAKDAENQRTELRRRATDRAPVCLADLAVALSDPRRPIDDLYAEMIENTHDVENYYTAEYADVLKHPSQHPIVASGAAAMLNRPEDERGSVLSSAQSNLSLYVDPIVARNTRRSDFKLSDLMDSARPVTLYLAAREEDKDRLKPLMRLIINQIVRVLLRPELVYDQGRLLPPHKHRLLLMLDEFPSYGKLEVFEEALSYIAGYMIKAYLIMQDVEQLYKAYGENESLTSNCHLRVAYAPNKLKTAQWLSAMTGKTTVNSEEFSESGKKFGAVLDGISRSWRATERELLTTDEVMRLKAPEKDKEGNITSAGDLLLFAAGFPPIKGTQSLYFRDPNFVHRVKNPVPGRSDSDLVVCQKPEAATSQSAANIAMPATPLREFKLKDSASVVRSAP